MKRRMLLSSIVLMALVFLFLTGISPETAGLVQGGGMLSGAVWGYNWLDEAIPLVWASVSAYRDGVLVERVSTGVNGSYIMFLPSGLLNVTVECPGFKTQARMIGISEGASAQMNFYMERSEIPIPEFETYLLPVVAVVLLVLAKAVTKRRRR